MTIINGSSGNDTINGTTNSDVISGNGGNDTINAGDGNDVVSGGSGNDRIDGGEGNDTLSGGSGNDILLGGSGNDTLDGGAGNDMLTGGSGADLYVLTSNMGKDTVLDFQVGLDHLRLNGLTPAQLTLSIVDTDGNGIGDSTLIKINNTNSILLIGVNGVPLSALLEGAANAPPVIANQTLSVAENSAIGQTVGTVVASDPEGGSLTYAIVGGSPNFSINASTGVVTVASNLNFEAQSNYSLQIQVTDNQGAQSLASLAVNIQDVNEAPTNISLSNNSVNENSANGTVVGNLAATDPDAGATATFSLLDNAGGHFAISGNQLVVAAPLDFESQSSYNVTVRVTDNGGLTFDRTFAINVNDVNEAPTNISLSNNSVNENSANGTVVGNLAATDPDAGATATFSLLDNAGGHFAISGNQLVTAAPLDFEAQSSYNVTVRVTDNGGLTFDKSFAININDLPEAAPALFTNNAETVNFNTTLASSYLAGTQYDALGGNDIITLPDAANAAASGFVIGTAFSGGDGDDTIIGGNGNDQMNGGIGNDTLTGNAGNDIYNVNVNQGNDTITDFASGLDRLNILSGPGNPVSNITNSSNHPLLTFADGGSLLLSGNALLNTTITNVFENGDATIIRGLDNTNNTLTLSGSTNTILWTGSGLDHITLSNNSGDNTIYMDGTSGDGNTFFSFAGNVSGDNHIILGPGFFNENINLFDGLSGTGSISGKLTIDSAGGRVDLFNTNVDVDPASRNTYELHFNGSNAGDYYVDDNHYGLSIVYGNGGNDLLVVEDLDPNVTTPNNPSIGTLVDGGTGDDFINIDGYHSMNVYGGDGNDVIGIGPMGNTGSSDVGPSHPLPNINYTVQGSHTIDGGPGNDLIINETALAGTSFQTFIYHASWDGSTLVSNDGTDTIRGPNSSGAVIGFRGFTSTKDKIEIDVSSTNPSATASDILAHISVTTGDLNADGVIDSSLHFGNTNIDIWGVNLGSTPLSQYIDVHFI